MMSIEIEKDLISLREYATQHEFFQCEVTTDKLLEQIGTKNALKVASHSVEKVVLPIMENFSPEIEWPLELLSQIREMGRVEGHFYFYGEESDTLRQQLHSNGFVEALRCIYDAAKQLEISPTHSVYLSAEAIKSACGAARFLYGEEHYPDEYQQFREAQKRDHKLRLQGIRQNLPKVPVTFLEAPDSQEYASSLWLDVASEIEKHLKSSL